MFIRTEKRSALLSEICLCTPLLPNVDRHESQCYKEVDNDLKRS